MYAAGILPPVGIAVNRAVRTGIGRGIQGAVMNQPFGAVYADSYDLIYRDKDYAAESTLIESIFRTYNDTIRSVLDLGCGNR